ncbi:conserved hypothetical protein [Ricinus communis]|uniref:Uncharacterized protein n=1 Tax=Ricinus communis TaxID=3988 RepID=B9RU23_RICCO|nr:conserved hypothetical protein [Ricinus communis]
MDGRGLVAQKNGLCYLETSMFCKSTSANSNSRTSGSEMQCCLQHNQLHFTSFPCRPDTGIKSLEVDVFSSSFRLWDDELARMADFLSNCTYLRYDVGWRTINK